MAAGRDEGRLSRDRVEDLDPGPVESRVLGVVLRLVDPPLAHLLRVQAGRGVEDGDSIAHQLAVGDHRALDRLHGFEVDDAGLVRGHQVRDRQHRHGVDSLEAAEARAVVRIADVRVRRDPYRRRSAAAGKGGVTLRHRFHRGGAGNLLELNELRLCLDGGHDVAPALLGRHVVVDLRLLAGLGGVRDVDGDVVAARARLEGGDPVGKRLVTAEGQLRPGGRCGAVGADPHDKASATTIEEVAVDGVREVRAVHEVAEGLYELGPVRDLGRLVERTSLREANEGRDRRAHALDRS